MTANKASALSRGLSVLGKLFAGTRKGPSGSRVRKLRKLQQHIGVRFTDLSLLEQALTHRSYSHVTAQTRNDSNERMEFLGDSVLGLSVSQFLYLRFPDRSEGALSKMKSLLVSRKVLSTVSRDVGLGEFLLLSGEESDMGGRDRTSILADSFEGVIGAIYLDQGYRAANKFVQRFLLSNIHGILKDDDHTNFKSLLQEYVQSKRLSHPVYRVRKEEGPEHEKEFAVEVVIRGDVWGTGRGKSKKDAEQSAARVALETRENGAAAKPRGGAPRGERVSNPARSRPAAERSARPPRDRGEHGISASREKHRAQRREEAQAGETLRRRSEPRRPVAETEDHTPAAGGTRESTRPPRSRRGRRRRGERSEPSSNAPISESAEPTMAQPEAPAETAAPRTEETAPRAEAAPRPVKSTEPSAAAGTQRPSSGRAPRRTGRRRPDSARATGPEPASAPEAAAPERTLHETPEPGGFWSAPRDTVHETSRETVGDGDDDARSDADSRSESVVSSNGETHADGFTRRKARRSGRGFRKR